jgi:hypothetical protein
MLHGLLLLPQLLLWWLKHSHPCLLLLALQP